MNSIGIRGKLALLISIQILVACVVGGIGYRSAQNTQIIYGDIVGTNVPKIRALNRMLLAFRKSRIELLDLLVPGKDGAFAEEALKNYESEWEAYATDQKFYAGTPFDDGEREIFEQFSESVALVHRQMDEAVAHFRKDPREGSPDRLRFAKIMGDDVVASGKIVTGHIRKMLGFMDGQMKADGRDASEAGARGTRWSLLSILLGGLFGAAIGYAIARQLSASLTDVSESLAEGASAVSDALNKLTKASESLSASATEQAASLQETSASVEEISAMVRQSSDGAKESATASDLSKSRAAHGKEVVETMITSMGEIDQSNQTIFSEITDSNNRIADIMQLIQEIGNKTNVINDIVFQTKLLSFNASVEAARAGEHGKGFAVVAEEVGNLAQMSGNAAKEITTLLDSSIERVGSIVSETKAKVERLSRDVKVTVEKGGQVARDCGEVLDEIVTHAGTVSAMVQSIAQSSHEQANGVTEIAKAVQQLDLVTHSNSSAANQTAAAAGQLAEQARALKESSDVLRSIILGSGTSRTAAHGTNKTPPATGTKNGKPRSAPKRTESESAEPARRAA